MSLVEIETELPRLTAAELRHLAMTSWAAFLEKESANTDANTCSEESPELLAALDSALREAEGTSSPVKGADHVRCRLQEWTTK